MTAQYSFYGVLEQEFNQMKFDMENNYRDFFNGRISKETCDTQNMDAMQKVCDVAVEEDDMQNEELAKKQTKIENLEDRIYSMEQIIAELRNKIIILETK